MQTNFRSPTLRGLARGIAMSALSIAAMLALLCALVVAEARRDDLAEAGVGRVGAAVVLGAAPGAPEPAAALRARLDHALELYRRGQVRLIVVAGGVAGAPSGKQYLLGRGLPAEALLSEEDGASTWENVRDSVPLVNANRIGAVVLVGEPFQMLRALKMTRDLGLIAYSSPSRGAPPAGRLQQAAVVLREAWAYLVYIFARR
jgi:uncharacterized SAM-binding protein YcdF (DUF218 family)